MYSWVRAIAIAYAIILIKDTNEVRAFLNDKLKMHVKIFPPDKQ